MTKGTKTGGRIKGSKNKRTLEVERQAELAAERDRLLTEAGLSATSQQVALAKAAGKKLMKDIAFEFAHLFAGLAAFYQPYPSWTRTPDGKLVNGNPNYDEAKFVQYAVLAKDTALGAASFESPKLSAIRVSLPAADLPGQTIDGTVASDPAQRTEQASRAYLRLVKGNGK